MATTKRRYKRDEVSNQRQLVMRRMETIHKNLDFLRSHEAIIRAGLDLHMEFAMREVGEAMDKLPPAGMTERYTNV